MNARYYTTKRVYRGASMNIEIRDAALAAKMEKQREASGSASMEEFVRPLLETQEEQNRWRLEVREAFNTKA
jgi:hypothetical protein